MTEKSNIERRLFLKTAGAAGLASILSAKTFGADPNATCKTEDPNSDPNSKADTKKALHPQVPKRPLGKTGVKVPILNLGGMFDIPDNQIMLKKALQWGVNYWDTAHSYGNGQSELGIGTFLKKNPDARKNIFLVTKASRAKSIADIDSRLKTSFERMNTDYIDLYYGVHGLSDPAKLTSELRQWAEKAKKKGQIKYFGFSTHKNMSACLTAAAKAGWIDAVMTTYNYRQMQDPAMNAAIEDCRKAGVGIIAMKTQGQRQKDPTTEADTKIRSHFLERGFTLQQANIKAVWQDKRIATICSQMPNMAILISNIAAAMDKTKLTKEDMAMYARFANDTCDQYCIACGRCAFAVQGMPYVSEVMRYMMYYNGYGQKLRAKQCFANLPESVRKGLTRFDYRNAEAICPQKMPIAELMRNAATLLA